MPSVEDIEKIKTKLGVTKLTVVVDFDQLKIQIRKGGKVTFIDALESAIRSFIEDGNDTQSPVGVIELEPETFDLPSDADRAKVSEAIRGYMNLPSAEITLLHKDSDFKYPPQQGESIEENWIFLLSLSDLCYNWFWAIVDRKGINKTYNYGFG
ncbi:MAG: hypothetical protein KME46_31370 [Brasilonema angustatum HA4187-MV1]|jgi:hypothetical protein|nr:hypothetical protein [Brasilonema angustatum HA4187-MV1]